MISPAQAAESRKHRLVRRSDTDPERPFDPAMLDIESHHGRHHKEGESDWRHHEGGESEDKTTISKRYLVSRNGDDWDVKDLPIDE